MRLPDVRSSKEQRRWARCPPAAPLLHIRSIGRRGRGTMSTELAHERPCGPCRLEPCPRRRRGRGCAHPGERPAAAGREHPAGGAGRARVRGERPARAGAASREPDRRADDARRIRLVRRRAYGGGPVAAVHHRLRRRSPDRRILRAPRPRLPIGTARDQDRAPRGGGHVRLRVRASARVAALRRPPRPEMRRVPRERVPGVPRRHARRGPRAPDARLRPRDPGCRRCHPRPALAGRDRAAAARARARVPVRWDHGRRSSWSGPRWSRSPASEATPWSCCRSSPS